MPAGYRNITYLHLTVRDGCCGKTNKEVNSREIMQIDKLILIHLKYLILVLISAQNSDGIPFFCCRFILPFCLLIKSLNSKIRITQSLLIVYNNDHYHTTDKNSDTFV